MILFESFIKMKKSDRCKQKNCTLYINYISTHVTGNIKALNLYFVKGLKLTFFFYKIKIIRYVHNNFHI